MQQAVAARSWAADDELVIRVDDPFFGEQTTYLLSVEGGRGRCTTTTRAPDLVVPVDDLGSLHLGGVSPSTLVRAGRITAAGVECVQRADAMFRVDRAPFCCFDF